MKYHFRVHKEKNGYWGECIELEGCSSQGQSHEELKKNLKEALDLYLDEPEESSMVFPLPKRCMAGKNIMALDVDPQIALASLVRSERLKRRWSQKLAAQELGMPLYSYQRLEYSRTANPEWKTLIKLRKVFPDLDLNLAI
jgi:antitoxin HicB